MTLFHAAVAPALDNNGNPIDSAVWQFFRSGTSTPANVYADNALATSLGSQVTADSAGRFAVIFLNDKLNYRAVLKDAGGVTLKTIDSASSYSNAYITPQQFGAIGTDQPTIAIPSTRQL